jgi:hypothetical protein
MESETVVDELLEAITMFLNQKPKWSAVITKVDPESPWAKQEHFPLYICVKVENRRGYAKIKYNKDHDLFVQHWVLGERGSRQSESKTMKVDISDPDCFINLRKFIRTNFRPMEHLRGGK